jgi:hypothetical protein
MFPLQDREEGMHLDWGTETQGSQAEGFRLSSVVSIVRPVAYANVSDGI